MHFILNYPHYNVLNVTPNKSCYLHEIADELIKISGKNLRTKVLNDVEGYKYTGDNSLLKSELKDFVFTPLKDGLMKLYKHNLQLLQDTYQRVKLCKK